MTQQLHIHQMMAKSHAAGEFATCVALALKRVKNQPNDGLGWYWLALGSFSDGAFANALNAAKKASRLRPHDLRVRVVLGDAAAAAGDVPLAVASFQAAIRDLGPVGSQAETAALQFTLLEKMGAWLHGLNRLPEAVQAFSDSIKLQPQSAHAWFNLGATLLQLNEYVQAQRALEQSLNNGYPKAEAWSAIGVALMMQNEWLTAHQVLIQAWETRPIDKKTLNNLAIVCQQLGRLEEAETFVRQKLLLDDKDVMGWVNLGSILREQKRTDEAFAAYENALKYAPEDFGALAGMGSVYVDKHFYWSAVKVFRHALRAPVSTHPQYINALTMLGNVFANLGEHEECEACFRQALALAPDDRLLWAAWLFVLNTDPTKTKEEIFAEYKEFNATFAAKDALSTHDVAVDDSLVSERIHVGYVSADFTRHSVRNFLLPLLSCHDRKKFKITAFANMSGEDRVEEGYRDLVENWTFIKGLADREVVNLVKAQSIDILVDLSGHTAGNRLDLFAMHPAPVTVTWLGFGTTTGLTAIDYYLTDEYAVPITDDAYFSEKPWRLERPYLVYRPGNAMGSCGDLPAIHAGRITFASLSRTVRFNGVLFSAWAEILRKVPDSVLFLNSVNLQDVDLCREIQEKFQELGVNPSRIECGYESPPWNLLRRIDISLDCFPQNSGTTLFESLYMGIPYVTLTERPGVGRLGSAILHGLGRQEWVASTVAEYVEKAIALASDLPALEALRVSLRDEMKASALMDEKGFARSVEFAYTQMVVEHRNFQSNKSHYQ